MHRWRSGKAIALARLGRREEALPLMEEELELARRKGAPGTLGPTLRMAGELTGRRWRRSRRRSRCSTARPRGSSWPRRCSPSGAARRRRRCSSARTRWRRVAAPLPVLAGAREALAALGEAPGGPAGAAGLTGIERRVATLAAEGRPNRDIAQALFLTPRDVERHLAAAAGKLGSDSRRALAAALAG